MVKILRGLLNRLKFNTKIIVEKKVDETYANKLKKEIKRYKNKQKEFEEASLNFSKITSYFISKKVSHSILEDMTGTKPSRFCIQNSKMVSVDSWRELYILCLQYLNELDTKKFDNLINNEKYCSASKRKIFAKNSKDLSYTPRKIKKDFYADCNFSTKDLTRILIGLFKIFNIKSDEFQIYLYEK